MATDLERLVVQLEANTRRFEREMARARQTANKELSAIEKRAKQTNANLSRNLGGGLGGLGRFAGAAGAGLAANEVRKYADAWTEAGNRIKAAEQISGRQARTLSDLNTLASSTRSGLAETAELYAKLLTATKDVAKSEQEVAQATEIVNKAFKAGGAAASEQAAGVLQLSQALGSGILQGDELRSIRENAPLLAKAIADEFNTTVAGLKDLGAEGALTTDRVFRAIINSKQQIDAAFNATTATIGDGLTELGNAATEFIGVLSEITGLSGGATSGLSQLAESIRAVAAAMREGADTQVGQAFIKTLQNYARVLSGVATIDFVKGLASDAAEISDVRKQLAGMFAEYRKGLAAIKPSSLSAFDDLAAKIEAGTISADDAKKALEAIAGTDARLQQLPLAFDPLLDKLGEVVKAAESAAAAVGGIVGQSFRQSELASLDKLGALNAERDRFLGGLETEARRTEQEERIAAKTQEVMERAEKAGLALTEAAARIEAVKLLGIKESVSSLEGAITGFVDRVVQAESGGDSNAKNPRSTATGAGQFIESTWLNLFRKHFPAEAANMGREAILALRNDAEKSRVLIEAYARENAAILQKAGVSVNEVALQLSHFLGPQGAVNVLKAAPGTPVSEVLSAGQIKANPEILGGGATVEDVIAYGQARAGLNTVLTKEVEIRERNRQLVADMIAQGQEENARIQLETSLIGASNAEREKEMFIFERLNELKREGIPITDELLATVEAEANARYQAVSAYDAQAAAADRLQMAQEELAAVQQEVNDAFQGALKSFISDLAHGKSLTEALTNSLSRLADRLIDIGLDQIFSSFGSGGGGNILGKLFGFRNGGIAAHGKPRTFASGGVSRTAAIFGEAGPEAAVPLPDGRNIPVDLRMPKMPARQAANANSSRGDMNVSMTVITPDAPSFLESQNQIANKTAAMLERTMRTR